MKNTIFGICFLVALAWASPQALAQNHNVGYYVKIGGDSESTTYLRTYSLYTPTANTEPLRPGDIVVYQGGGNCNDVPGQVDCIDGNEDEDYLIKSGGGRGMDRIVVIGRRIVSQYLLIFTQPAPSPGAGSGLVDVLRDIPDTVAEESDAEDCTAQKVGDMGGLLTPAQQQLIADFLNSAAAGGLWNDSNFTMPHMGAQGRLEQAGFLLPDGSFIRATGSSGPCQSPSVGFGPQPVGTIFVHTHPYSNGESLAHCGVSGIYRNRPSHPDDVSIVANIPGVSIGLIIDADGIIVFTDDYHPVYDPDEAQHKGGEDGKCGFNRR